MDRAVATHRRTGLPPLVGTHRSCRDALCYSSLSNVPTGVSVADASSVVPEHAVCRYVASGSLAIFGDWFRLRLQALGRGIWGDCDAYMVDQLDDRQAYVMGLDRRGGAIQTGVLRLPPDCPMLQALLKFHERPFVPKWLRPRQKVEATLKHLWTPRRLQAVFLKF